MPTKADRRVPLPAGLVPLLSQQELETFYGVSDWTVLKWIENGMPVEPMRNATGEKQQRRFNLAAVQAWHAEQMPASA
jgi:phage terminase Nu1 subunit (DNA packaging protein)